MPENSIELIDLQSSLKPFIPEIVNEFGDSYSVLLIAKAKNQSSILSSFLDFFINDKGLEGVFLTVNKQYSKILDSLKQVVPKAEQKLFFIDCSSETGKETDNVIFAAPQDLTELSLIINSVFKKRSKANFFVLDSLSTLLVYNDEKTVEKFARALVQKASSKKIKLVVVATRTPSNDSTIETVSSFFDKVLQLDNKQ